MHFLGPPGTKAVLRASWWNLRCCATLAPSTRKARRTNNLNPQSPGANPTWHEGGVARELVELALLRKAGAVHQEGQAHGAAAAQLCARCQHAAGALEARALHVVLACALMAYLMQGSI